MDKKVSTQEWHILGCKGQWFWFMDLAQIVEAANFLVYEFIRFEIQNGKSVSFWFDDWLVMWKLLDIRGDLGTRYLGVLRSATLTDPAGDESSWKIRARGHHRYPGLYAKIATVTLPDMHASADRVVWKNDKEVYTDSFSTTMTWNSLKSKKDKVIRRHLVWFSQVIPCQPFILWLAFQNCLSTGDRMRTWCIDQGCMLCGERDETRDRLFYACPYFIYCLEEYCREVARWMLLPMTGMKQ